MPAANNVTRLLVASRVPYEVFETPPAKLGAEETAAFLGVSPVLVFKTIVILTDPPGKPLLVLVPGTRAVDLKKVARISGTKKVRVPTEREAETLTGLQAGGISPLALLNKGFRVLIDAEAQKHERIHISAGQRGLNLRLGVDDLIRLTNALIADVGRPA
jgi:Cys-tRNA(Pro)/Cys-tRNA(Cys) deacylase